MAKSTYQKAHPEKARERTRKWRAENPDKARHHARESARRWRSANPEKARESYRRVVEAYTARSEEQILEDRARLRPDGMKRCIAGGHVTRVEHFDRNATKPDGLRDICRDHATTRLLKHVWPRWEDLDLWRCIYCDAPFEHVEHVIPRARGGSDHPENLAPACADCNLSKHARTPAEWQPEVHAAMREVVRGD